MPGIDGGGAVGCRTLTGPFWRRCEFTACIATAKFDLLDCIADTVTNVPWIVLITSVRRFRHHNAYVARRNRRVCKLENLRSALRVFDLAGMENLPFAFGAAVEIERVGADPVFDLIGFGERRSPLNARGIDLFVGLEIDDDPLWMERIRFAGESDALHPQWVIEIGRAHV